MAKTCSRCLVVKDESDFPKNSASPDGLYSLCKACRKSAQAAYRARPDVVSREAIRLRQDYLDKGGANGPENLQLLCPACNRQKADKVDWVPSGS